MFQQISLLTMMMLAMTFAVDSEYFYGDATTYVLSQVSAGNCNFMYDLGVGHNYAALNSEQWDSTRNCGRCAQVSCDDDRCSNKDSTIVYIVDRCPDCVKGSLDLSPTVFKQLTGSSPSRYTIKWKFVNCPVSGNINYCTKSGSSSSWLAVQPTNHASGVANMKIANQEVTMVDSSYYFLLNGGTNVDISAVDIEITSVAGETITETLSLTPNNCTVGTANFKKITTQESTSQTPLSIQPTRIPTSDPARTPVASMVTAQSTPTATASTTPTAAAPTIKIATPESTTLSYTFNNGDSSQFQSQTQQEQQKQQEPQQDQNKVTNSFAFSKSDSGPKYKSGSVIAANEPGSDEKNVLSRGVSVEEMSSVQQEDEFESFKQPVASDNEHVTTKAEATSLGTNTVVIAFIVLAVVCGIVFAAVVFFIKKKKRNDKRIDQDMAMMRSFDTFSSPVRFDETIAKM